MLRDNFLGKFALKENEKPSFRGFNARLSMQ